MNTPAPARALHREISLDEFEKIQRLVNFVPVYKYASMQPEHGEVGCLTASVSLHADLAGPFQVESRRYEGVIERLFYGP